MTFGIPRAEGAVVPTNPNYDAYREALVVETTTLWGEDCGAVAAAEREPIARRLHADPQNADQLEYVRLHAGFCRRITVTPADLERLK
jgi:hypothetical protein